MQKTIITLIPQYGELNRISKDWIVSHTFSFEKQKFIVDFYSEWSDIKAFERAILELVLHTPYWLEILFTSIFLINITFIIPKMYVILLASIKIPVFW